MSQSLKQSNRSILHALPERLDAFVENHGSIFLVRPLSNSACEWITAHVSEDSQYFGNALVVEWRYIDDLVAGMRGDGLVIR